MGDDSENRPFPHHLDGNPGGDRLVEDAVDILTKFGSGNPHVWALYYCIVRTMSSTRTFIQATWKWV